MSSPLTTKPDEFAAAVGKLLETLMKCCLPAQDARPMWEANLCAMILSLNPHCKIYQIIESLPADKKPMDAVGFLNTMANLGYIGFPTKLDISQIDERLAPCLFIPEGTDHSIFIQKKSGTVLDVYNAEHGKVFSVPAEDFVTTKGEVWFFKRFDPGKLETSKYKRDTTGKSWFRAIFDRFHKLIKRVFWCVLLLTFLGLATPLFIILVYDRTIAAGAINNLPYIVAGMVLFATSEWLLRVVQLKNLAWLSSRLDNLVSAQIFEHLLQLPPGTIERASISSQIARIKTFESIRDFFSSAMFLAAIEAPFILIALITMGIIAGSLVWVPIVMGGVYLLLYYYLWRRVKVNIRYTAKASSQRQQFTIDTFDKIKNIRANGLVDKWYEKYRLLSGRETLASFRLNWLGSVGEIFGRSITVMSAVLIISFGVEQVWSHQLSTGALVASMILVWRILTPLYSLNTMILKLEQLRNAIMQVNKLMDVETEAMLNSGSAQLSSIRGKIEFVKVGMRYDEMTAPIFTNLTFKANAGEMIAITGSDGTGKSTLIKVLKRLYPHHEGAIYLDDFDIRQLDVYELRRQIAYIPQDPDFFEGTLLDNIKLANPLLTQEAVQEAINYFGLRSAIDALPQGLNTVISAKHSLGYHSHLLTTLSAIRAYLHQGKILLIDELPNAFLSSASGQNLKHYLAKIKGKKTIVMATFRSDFMQLADTVIALSHDQSPLVGPRDQVLNKIGLRL